MKFFKEFKEFISRGNVMDLAAGVIIGAAFTAIVTALVDNIISPLLGIITGDVNFGELSATVNGAEIQYGSFINAVINFVLVALVLFIVIKAINSMHIKKREPEPAVEVFLCPSCRMEVHPEATRCPHCTSEIVREPDPEPPVGDPEIVTAQASPRPSRTRRKLG